MITRVGAMRAVSASTDPIPDSGWLLFGRRQLTIPGAMGRRVAHTLQPWLAFNRNGHSDNTVVSVTEAAAPGVPSLPRRGFVPHLAPTLSVAHVLPTRDLCGVLESCGFQSRPSRKRLQVTRFGLDSTVGKKRRDPSRRAPDQHRQIVRRSFMWERTMKPRRCGATRVAEISPRSESEGPERIIVRCQKVLLHDGEHVYFLPDDQARQFRWGLTANEKDPSADG